MSLFSDIAHATGQFEHRYIQPAVNKTLSGAQAVGNAALTGLGAVGGIGSGAVQAVGSLAQGNPGAAGQAFKQDVALGITAGQAFNFGTQTGVQARAQVKATNQAFVAQQTSPVGGTLARVLTAAGPPQSALERDIVLGLSIAAPLAGPALRGAGRGVGALAEEGVARYLAPRAATLIAVPAERLETGLVVKGAGDAFFTFETRAAEGAAYQESARGAATILDIGAESAVRDNLASTGERLAAESATEGSIKAGGKGSGFFSRATAPFRAHPFLTVGGAAAAGLLAIDILNPRTDPKTAGSGSGSGNGQDPRNGNGNGGDNGTNGNGNGNGGDNGNPTSPPYSTGLFDNITAGLGSAFERVGAGIEEFLGGIGVNIGAGAGKALAIGGTAVLIGIAVSKSGILKHAPKAAKAGRAARGIRIGA